MNIVIINFSGNVGKTTIARHVLAPRLAGATIIPIETINAGDVPDETAISGRQYDDLMEAMVLEENAIIDVGSSNVEAFMRLMQQYEASHEDFDAFIVPTVPQNKQIRDTISTIDALLKTGVPPQRIKTVLNRVERFDKPQQVFATLFDYHAAERRFSLPSAAWLHENELYDKLQDHEPPSIEAVLADTTDLKAAMTATDDREERIRLARRLALRRLASGAQKEHDRVFTALELN